MIFIILYNMFIILILIVEKTFYKMRKKSRAQARNENGKVRRAHEAVLAETASNIEHEAQRVVVREALNAERIVREALYAERIAREERKVENIAREASEALKASEARKEFLEAESKAAEREVHEAHKALVEAEREVRRLILAKFDATRNSKTKELVERLDMAAKEYIKENPLQDNIQLTGTTFTNCIISTHHYDIIVAIKLSILFVDAGVSQSNVIKAIHIVHERFFKETKTIQNFFKTIQPGILRKLKNWFWDPKTNTFKLRHWDLLDWWGDYELNYELECTTETNTKFFEIDTYFKRKCSKRVSSQDIKEFEDNKLFATFLLVNQRLASTGKYVSISILDMLELLKTYDNKLR